MKLSNSWKKKKNYCVLFNLSTPDFRTAKLERPSLAYTGPNIRCLIWESPSFSLKHTFLQPWVIVEDVEEGAAEVPRSWCNGWSKIQLVNDMRHQVPRPAATEWRCAVCTRLQLGRHRLALPQIVFGSKFHTFSLKIGSWQNLAVGKISFGGIPNSSNIDILMPYAIFDCMGVFLRSGFAHVDNVIPVIKAITWLLLWRLQGNKPDRNFPEPSEPFLLNLRQHTPEPSEIFQNLPELASGTYTVFTGTLRNLPEPASGTYTILQRNSPEASGTRLRNLHQHTPELSEIFRNLPELASGNYTVLHRNSPEPSGTCLGNLHHFTKELSGTFRNPPPEPTPAHSGTLRNLPEPSSGTGSCDPHRHTPELIWAEDPISLRCWVKKKTSTQFVGVHVSNRMFSSLWPGLRTSAKQQCMRHLSSRIRFKLLLLGLDGMLKASGSDVCQSGHASGNWQSSKALLVWGNACA